MKLDDPRTIRLLIRICVVGLVLLAGIDLVYEHKAHFKHQQVFIDAWPFFYPVYGFVVCTLMVWGAKKLFGTVFMRPEDYYGDGPQALEETGADASGAPTTDSTHPAGPSADAGPSSPKEGA